MENYKITIKTPSFLWILQISQLKNLSRYLKPTANLCFILLDFVIIFFYKYSISNIPQFMFSN